MDSFTRHRRHRRRHPLSSHFVLIFLDFKGKVFLGPGLFIDGQHRYEVFVVIVVISIDAVFVVIVVVVVAVVASCRKILPDVTAAKKSSVA